MVIFKENNIKINSRFFGISLLTNNKVLILGGVDITKDHKDVDFDNKKYYNHSDKTYYYDFDQNEIIVSNQTLEFEFFLGEKFFHPINDNSFLILPLNDLHSGFIYKDNMLEKVNYNENENKLFDQVFNIGSIILIYRERTNRGR